MPVLKGVVDKGLHDGVGHQRRQLGIVAGKADQNQAAGGIAPHCQQAGESVQRQLFPHRQLHAADTGVRGRRRRALVGVVADQFGILVEVQLANHVHRHAVALQHLGLGLQILGVGRPGAAIQGEGLRRTGSISMRAVASYIGRVK